MQAEGRIANVGRDLTIIGGGSAAQVEAQRLLQPPGNPIAEAEDLDADIRGQPGQFQADIEFVERAGATIGKVIDQPRQGRPAEAVKRLDPIFRALAPGVDSAPRTPGRTGEPSSAENGYLHCGPSGAGHFVKMVHNGIEYGLMAAYAEGLNILKHANAGSAEREVSAEVTPLRDPDNYKFDLDLTEVAEVWRRGSVVASWLLDLTAQALADDSQLGKFVGAVADSGEGRWTIQAALDEAVPADVLSAALYARFRSREEHTFGERMLSAMRFGFGGHVEAPAKG